MELSFIVSGFVVGILVGATGVGGGSLMTPLLVLMFGVPPGTAVGTDLLYAAITKTGGAFAHNRHDHVDWRIVSLLGAGSIPAALLTVLALRTLSVDTHQYATVIKSVLGVALILTALALIFKERLRLLGQRYSTTHHTETGNTRAVATVITGAVLGVLVTVSSVGAGALGVAALFFLYPSLVTSRIVGSDIAHAVPLTLVAGLGHASMGGVDWTLLGTLLIGSLPGVWIGSSLSRRMPERFLRGTLATLLVLIGAKLI